MVKPFSISPTVTPLIKIVSNDRSGNPTDELWFYPRSGEFGNNIRVEQKTVYVTDQPAG